MSYVTEMQAHWFQPSQEQYLLPTIQAIDLCIWRTQKLSGHLSWFAKIWWFRFDFLDVDIMAAVTAFQQCPYMEYTEGSTPHFGQFY